MWAHDSPMIILAYVYNYFCFTKEKRKPKDLKINTDNIYVLYFLWSIFKWPLNVNVTCYILQEHKYRLYSYKYKYSSMLLSLIWFESRTLYWQPSDRNICSVIKMKPLGFVLLIFFFLKKFLMFQRIYNFIILNELNIGLDDGWK